MRKDILLTGGVLLGMAAGMVGSQVAASDGQSVYDAMETYRQVLVVEHSEDAGDMPPPELAAVYDGRKWGLSTRWDDSNPNALNVRRKMLAGGIRGTFYLNSREPEEEAGSLAARLTGQGECSVGGHSVSHPRLPELSVNETFYQLMANRITLESLTNRPVNSLAFPYGGYDDKARPEVLEGISESFLRTGYHHCVYAGFVKGNPFLPANLVSTGLQVVPGDRKVDAEKFWTQIEKVRQFESQSRETSDCIFLGVHPWQEGEELERLGEVMGKLKTWDDFWHCTQTEYAAFARQRRSSKIEALGRGEFAIVRPCATELGSDIPLTLVFAGNSVRSAKVDGKACAVRQAEGKTIVNVPHCPEHGVPVKIAETTEGVSKEFPGLKVSFTFEPKTGQIAYVLENGTDTTLSDAVLTVSPPPAFEPGRLRWNRQQVAKKDRWSVSGATSPTRMGVYWQSGTYYVAAQLDFVLNREPVRLFTTCTVGPEAVEWGEKG